MNSALCSGFVLRVASWTKRLPVSPFRDAGYMNDNNTQTCTVCGGTDWLLEPVVDEVTGLVDSQWQWCPKCPGSNVPGGGRAYGVSDVVRIDRVS